MRVTKSFCHPTSFRPFQRKKVFFQAPSVRRSFRASFHRAPRNTWNPLKQLAEKIPWSVGKYLVYTVPFAGLGGLVGVMGGAFLQHPMIGGGLGLLLGLAGSIAVGIRKGWNY